MKTMIVDMEPEESLQYMIQLIRQIAVDQSWSKNRMTKFRNHFTNVAAAIKRDRRQRKEH